MNLEVRSFPVKELNIIMKNCNRVLLPTHCNRYFFYKTHTWASELEGEWGTLRRGPMMASLPSSGPPTVGKNIMKCDIINYRLSCHDYYEKVLFLRFRCFSSSFIGQLVDSIQSRGSAVICLIYLCKKHCFVSHSSLMYR